MIKIHVAVFIIVCIVFLPPVIKYSSIIFNDASFKSQQLSKDTIISIEPEKIPLGAASVYVPVAEATGINVKKNTVAEIDYSNAAEGYVMVRSLDGKGKDLKAIVKTPGGKSYTYVLSAGGRHDVLPLTEGNGNYQVGIYENVKGSKYSTVISATIKVALKDEFAPFLRPNQYVNYSASAETVKKAAALTENVSGQVDKVITVYNYVIGNITYDKELAATVKSGYLTDVDAVLKKGKGICFDYAAVMASMLRSQRIPTKLVIGYTGADYHAWVNVYTAEKGWVDKVIYFDGANWTLMDPTFAANKSIKSGAKISYSAKLEY